MRTTALDVLLVVIVGLALAGCEQLPAHPPQTVVEFLQRQRSGGQEYTPHATALHNANRVLNDTLTAEERVESLRVLERVDVAGEQTYPTIAIVLTDESAPTPVRHAVLAFLAERDCPGLAEYVAQSLPHAGDAQLRATLLEWLQKHPTPTSLVGIVKLWAAEKTISEENEARYRRLVERISGKKWADALLDGLNTRDFFARGSAIEILASRLGPERLRRRISALVTRTQAVRVLQYFSDSFGYVPKTRRELLASVILNRRGRERLALAERLANKWQGQYDYRFNIRDFHLVSRMAADPLRKPVSRAHLILEISGSIAGRRKARQTDRTGAGSKAKRLFRRGRLVDFDAQTDSLTIVDLWNLRLINEMLNRPRVRLALKITAERDRADRTSQWGGLVRYKQGQAEAELYRPAAKQGDDRYVPSGRMLNDALDCLCYFVGHFSRIAEDASRIGPGEKELAFAGKYNVCGVVFTSLPDGRLNATYFNPEGLVVDLGEFGK